MRLKRITIAALLLAMLLPATAYADGTRRHHVEPQQEQQEKQEQTLNAYDGVYEFGGRTETYYSSNVLRHYRTDEWTADEQGFYRTEEGYYVVAASDMEQGTVFEGSMGLCQVLDCGCDDGITDYYTAW